MQYNGLAGYGFHLEYQGEYGYEIGPYSLNQCRSPTRDGVLAFYEKMYVNFNGHAGIGFIDGDLEINE